jgi:colanic acid/amylovoran biosynthesis glycosyltransferase
MTERATPPVNAGRLGYVLKVFPRVSETFVINEILAMESFGEKVNVFSCHHPPGVVTHATLNLMSASLTYLEDRVPDEETVGRARRHLQERFRVTDEQRERFLPRKYVRLAVAMADIGREQQINHLHAHFASRSAHVALLASGIMGCPLSMTAHAKDIYHDEVDPDVLRWKISQAKFVATVTDFNLAHLRALVGDDANARRKIVRVYNGIDLSQFRPTAPALAKRPLILSIGRLVEKKGFEVLVRACRILVDEGRTFDCEIIGGGEREVSIREIIAELGLDDVVKLRGTLPTEQVAERLREAYALVLPCIVGSDGNVDALPTVIIEAMATARPVISTRLSGIPEMIVDGETGLLAEPSDPVSLARAITDLLATPDRAVAMGLAARRRAEQLFDLTTNAGQIRRLIRSDPPPLPTV